MMFRVPVLIALAVLLSIPVVLNWERPPMDSEQKGFRGLGMAQIDNPRLKEAKLSAVSIPEPLDPADPDGEKASEVYENVQVLGDLNEEQFLRLMTAVTEWVSPEEGCTYCHNEENLAEDKPYTKIVARRMFEMTKHINKDWSTHVGETGVTCYTCHRGQPVPPEVWFKNPGGNRAAGWTGDGGGQNAPAPAAGYTSLPYDPYSELLEFEKEIRVAATTALPEGEIGSMQQTERTYGLMMHLSQALGVNCTYCHNSRSFFAWDQSSPMRTKAWHGIRMVRDVNKDYLEPLTSQFPKNRLGPLGDVAKVNCTSCHQGLAKPLNGANMVQHYPELKE